jgi:hypothetical protein
MTVTNIPAVDMYTCDVCRTVVNVRGHEQKPENWFQLLIVPLRPLEYIDSNVSFHICGDCEPTVVSLLKDHIKKVSPDGEKAEAET